jgi:hypothetical protein
MASQILIGEGGADWVGDEGDIVNNVTRQGDVLGQIVIRVGDG